MLQTHHTGMSDVPMYVTLYASLFLYVGQYVSVFSNV